MCTKSVVQHSTMLPLLPPSDVWAHTAMQGALWQLLFYICLALSFSMIEGNVSQVRGASGGGSRKRIVLHCSQTNHHLTHRVLPWPGRQVVEPCARDMGPVVCLLLWLGYTSHIDGRPGPALELSLDIQLLHQGLQGMLRRCPKVSNMASRASLTPCCMHCWTNERIREAMVGHHGVVSKIIDGMQ